MNRKAIRFATCTFTLALCAALSLPARAQVAGATLLGTITDPQGAAVPNANVTAKNGATGVSTSATTNGAGTYTIVNLIPGDYDVSVTAQGFTTATSKVTLTVGAKQELNIPLAVGQLNQIIEVTGAAPIVQTTDASVSGEVNSTQIVSLPLNGRDWAQLATLQPGVASVRPHEEVDAPGGSTRGLGMQLTVDGNRPQQNAYRLNGAIINDYSNAGPGNVLGFNTGVDAIQEFSVLISNYSAEYGYTSGGVINAITKSGTNTFHGSAYEFIRNSDLDAANFFENANNEPKGNFQRNQFGASGGWKIIRDRAFIFGDYEGLRQNKAVTQVAQSLAPNARLGILNDASGHPLPALVGPCPFPNETNHAPGVASSCVDNAIFKLINPTGNPAGGLEPLPNGILLGPDFNVGRFNSDGVQTVTDNYGTVRVDFKISDKDNLDGSWYTDHSLWTKPDAFNQTRSGFQVPHGLYTIEENHIISSNTVNTIRLARNESDLFSPTLSDSNPLSHDTTLGIMPGCTAPGISIGSSGLSANSATASGFSGFTGAPGFSARTAIVEAFDDLSRTFGKHNMRVGFMYLNQHENWLSGPGGCGGSASFASEFNFLNNIPSKVRLPQIPPFTAGNTVHHFRQQIIAGYVQDDWKMRPNFTMNLGLRYEMATIPSEVNDKINQLMAIYENPNTVPPCVESAGGLAVCNGFYHAIFQRNPTTKDFEPRIGFNWDPFRSGKTAVAWGFGVFDNLPLSYMFALNSLQTAPNGAEIDESSPGQGTYPGGFAAAAGSPSASARWGYDEQYPHRNYVMQWNASVQRQLTSTLSFTIGYTGSRGLHNPFQTDELNTVFPYSTSAGWLFPNPIGSGCLPAPPDCSATDVALGLPANFSANPTAIVPGLLINPFTADIQSTIFDAESRYNAMQVNVVKRLSRGVQLQGTFTWGHSTDTSSSSFAGDNYANNISPTIPWWDLAITKGPSDFSVTRNLVINGLWQIPVFGNVQGFARGFVQGWSLQGIFEASDGTPMWALDGVEGDPMGQLNGEPIAIPDLVSGCSLTNPSSGRHGALQYINPSCFINAQAPNAAFFNAPAPLGCDPKPPIGPKGAPETLAAAGLPPLTCFNLLGNEPRNIITGPGLINTDFSIIKDNFVPRISESFNVQFRAEFFNIFNRTNFAPPNVGNLEALDATGHTPGGFGTLTATQGDNRQIQFGLKVVW